MKDCSNVSCDEERVSLSVASEEQWDAGYEDMAADTDSDETDAEAAAEEPGLSRYT